MKNNFKKHHFTLLLGSLIALGSNVLAQTTGTTLNTNHGISTLSRTNNDNNGWPMVRKGAWTVLESKTKGFVVNRLTNNQINSIPSTELREGMMIYNIDQDCLQINTDGTPTGWKCFNNQTCPN